jgi:hypothetical protein
LAGVQAAPQESAPRSSLINFTSRYRWIFVAALPLVLAALFVLMVIASSYARYEPAYFSQACVDRYSWPGAVALALDQALRADDDELLAELQGLRRPVSLKTSPTLNMVVMLERDDRYYYYLYFDTETYERHTHAVERVQNRWVVAPPDAYFYLYSGRWIRTAGPVSVLWWLLEVTVLSMRWMFLAAARYRETLYDGRRRGK